MNEAEAIRKWIRDSERKYPHAFIYKIPDSTHCPCGRFNVMGKRPFDVVAYGVNNYDFCAMEFKVARTHNPAGALAALLPHQLDSLVRLGKILDHRSRAACTVYLPRQFRQVDMGTNRDFFYYYAGDSCRSCELSQAPHFSTCKICPYSKDGKPDIHSTDCTHV